MSHFTAHAVFRDVQALFHFYDGGRSRRSAHGISKRELHQTAVSQSVTCRAMPGGEVAEEAYSQQSYIEGV
eukprot:4930241-Pleurochrysis_carterae.AAC.7